MNIPETLLKLPEKELKKILAEENIYKAKYVVYDGQIFEVDKKYKNRIFFKEGRDESFRDFLDYYSLLSFNAFIEMKRMKILDSINDWEYDQWFNWCVKQFIHSYGEEYVDITQKPYIIVHFPEITISNSMEQSHIIRDLYLRFCIGNASVGADGLKRGTLTDAEIRNKYTFSHVNNGGDCFWWADSFCFGDTQISKLKNIIRRGRKEVFKNLSFFLEAIKEYLSWESLEGVPYKKIDEVIYDKNLWRNVEYYPSERMINFVKQNLESFTYTFNNNNEGYYLQLDDNSRETIANMLTENFPEYCSLYLDGRSVERRNVDTNKYDIPQHICWKGEYRPFKLINTIDINAELPKRINNNVLESICKQLETKFNKFLKEKKLNEYTIES